MALKKKMSRKFSHLGAMTFTLLSLMSTGALAQGLNCAGIFSHDTSEITSTSRPKTRALPAPALGPVRATVDVDPSAVIGRIDKYHQSIFVEPYYEGVENGLSAEKLANPSFEGPLDCRKMPEGWHLYPNPRLNNVEFSHEVVNYDSVPQHLRPKLNRPQQALRFRFDNYKDQNGGMVRGISQHGIPIEDGKEYIVTFWAKSAGKGYLGDIKLSFGPPGEEPHWYDEKVVSDIAPEWKEYSVRLKPSIPRARLPEGKDLAAWFVMRFEGGHPEGYKDEGSYLFLDQVSIMPADHVDRTRRDVFALLKKLRPNSTRYGGIATSFLTDYFDIIGEPGSRLNWFNGWEDTLQSPSFGYQEFFDLSKNLKAPPTITVNMHGENALQKTMDFLSYCFDPADSGFGELRARLGRKEPLNTEEALVELANEPWLYGFERDRPINPAFIENRDPKIYAQMVNRFAEAIHAKYPNVKLIAAGDRDPTWYEPIIEISGKHIWGIALHWYLEWGQRNELMGQPQQIQDVINRMQDTNRRFNGDKALKIAFNEWNSRLAMPYQHGMEASVHVASVWNLLLKNSPTATASANAMTVNGYPGNLINADQWGNTFVTPIYLQNLLYQRRSGPNVVTADAKGLSQNLNGHDISYIDSAATVSDNGKRLYIHVVNRNMTEDITTQINLKGVKNVNRVLWEIIMADNILTHNTFTNPNAIGVKEFEIAQGQNQWTITVPKHSISVITVELRKGPRTAN